MIDALIKRVSVSYKCYELYAHRGKKVQLLVFWDRSRNGRHLIKSPKQCLGGLLFLLRFLFFLLLLLFSFSFLSFFGTMELSTADLRNYWTECHETWWSYRYMFLVGPKVFSFVVKGVKVILWRVQMGWGLL